MDLCCSDNACHVVSFLLWTVAQVIAECTQTLVITHKCHRTEADTVGVLFGPFGSEG